MDQERLKHYLNSLKQDLVFYNDPIFEVSNEILTNEISNNPIFIAHMGKLGIGELILDKEELDTNWSIQVSTLEEFTKIGIIQKEKVQEFKASFKDPKKHMCVFLFTKEGASFVYFPYKKQNPNAVSD
jgi:hypothetical protein